MSCIQYLLAGDLVHIKKFKALASNNQVIEYMGYAAPGTLDTDPRWFIKKMIYDGNGFQTDETFAGGNANFDKSWALKGSYTYS